MEGSFNCGQLFPALKSALRYLSGSGDGIQQTAASPDVDVMTGSPTFSGTVESEMESAEPNEAGPSEPPLTPADEPPSLGPIDEKLQQQTCGGLNLNAYKIQIRRMTEDQIQNYLSIRDIGPLIKRCPARRGKKRKNSGDDEYFPETSTSGFQKPKNPSTNKSTVYWNLKKDLRKDQKELSWLNFYDKVKRFIAPHEKDGARAYWENMAPNKQRTHIPRGMSDEIMAIYRRRAQRPV